MIEADSVDIIGRQSSARQPRHRSTSTARAGPLGGCSHSCGYLTRSRSNARSRLGPSPTICARPSARTHHSRLQSSSYRSTRRLTRGSARTLTSRCNRRCRFGFSSTMSHTLSPSRANTTGTRCGAPSGRIVASLATRAVLKRARASSSFIGASLRVTALRVPSADPRLISKKYRSGTDFEAAERRPEGYRERSRGRHPMPRPHAVISDPALGPPVITSLGSMV